MIKHAPWTHYIWLYFFTGGLAGGCGVISAIADIAGKRDDRPIVRAGRWLALLLMPINALFLVLDLGRPTRFVNMLRVLKFRSPMSFGTWIFSAYGGLALLNLLAQGKEDGWIGGSGGRDVSKPLGITRCLLSPLTVLFGMGMASYTGVLLAATAIPLWARNTPVMGPLFLSSALSTSLAAIRLKLGVSASPVAERSLIRLERAERMTMLAELGLLAATMLRTGDLGKPLRTGRIGAQFGGGTVVGGLLLPLGLSLISRKRKGRGVALAASALTLTGGALLRRAMMYAGERSASDPAAAHLYNRLP